MKIILIIAGLFLMFTANAQMSQQSYFPFSYLSENTKNMRYQPDILISNDNPMYYGTATVLFGTFLINHFIGKSDQRRGNFENTAKKTGTVFVAGIVLSTGVFTLENRLIKNRMKAKLY